MAGLSVDLRHFFVKEEGQTRLINWLFCVVVCLLTCGLYYHFIVNTSFVELEIEVAQKTKFEIFWAGPGESYSAAKKGRAWVTPDKKQYGFFLTNIGKVDRLRVDTHQYEGEVTVKALSIRQGAWAPIELLTAKDFARLTPLAQIDNFRVDDKGLWVKSTGSDPNFELVITPISRGLNNSWLILRFVVLSFFVSLALYFLAPLAKNFRFVPVFLFGAWVLIIVMASISQYDVHPDEYVHQAAVLYYGDNWLPPVMEDPAIKKSYSVYGVSRLNNGEVYYLFAGKVHKFLQPFKVPKYLSVRVFNVMLFGLIFLYTVRNRYARMVALPLLISPQIWYVFSYCASDALALFFTFILACELIDPKSLLYRFLRDDGWWIKIAGAVVLSVLLAIAFLLKKNYYPFIVFFYLCLVVRLFFAKEFFGDKKIMLRRLLFISLAGLAICGLRLGADYMVNGLDRQEKIVALQEDLAHFAYKPSTALQQKYEHLYLKDRNVTLRDMVGKMHWFENSFRTSFGSFGYTTIYASKGYYKLIGWLGIFLFIFVVGSVFLRGGWFDRGFLVATLGLGVALIGASFYHSWTADFQAQGRYLLPIIPTLGIFYGWKHNIVNKQALFLGVYLMYFLSAYCFIIEGLLRIPKV